MALGTRGLLLVRVLLQALQHALPCEGLVDAVGRPLKRQHHYRHIRVSRPAQMTTELCFKLLVQIDFYLSLSLLQYMVGKDTTKGHRTYTQGVSSHIFGSLQPNTNKYQALPAQVGTYGASLTLQIMQWNSMFCRSQKILLIPGKLKVGHD